MTRLSKARQEEAASSGIIPLLKRVIVKESPLKQFVLPILCDMASAGKVSRRLLWQNDGMERESRRFVSSTSADIGDVSIPGPVVSPILASQCFRLDTSMVGDPSLVCDMLLNRLAGCPTRLQEWRTSWLSNRRQIA
jgi:hypothetical protein